MIVSVQVQVQVNYSAILTDGRGDTSAMKRILISRFFSEVGQYLVAACLPAQAGKVESRPFFRTVGGLGGVYGVSLDIENYCTVSLFFEQAYL